MTAQTPKLDLFLSPHGEAWRLYVGARSWAPPMLRKRMDRHGEVFPVAAPDLDDLERHMWGCDAPYEKRVATTGGVELGAVGRSAVVLLVWLEGLVRVG